MDRRYRIRVFDKHSEVLEDRKHWLSLDLDGGPSLREAEAKLDGLLQTLARRDGARGQRVADYRLQVEDWVTGEALFDWPARTWPTDDY